MIYIPEEKINKVIKIVLENCFGYWINGIWFSDKNLTLLESKELFFLTLKRLLDEERVVVFPPEEYYHQNIEDYTVPVKETKGYRIWDISSDEVIAYLQKNFPKDVTDENDLELTYYWFGNHCPRVGWIDQKTGEIVAS